MANRGKVGQARHDGKVQQRVERYREAGYRTQADLPGRSKPQKFGGRIPDIVARKPGELIVEEVETKSTVDSDRKQQQQLRAGVKKSGGKFRVTVA